MSIERLDAGIRRRKKEQRSSEEEMDGGNTHDVRGGPGGLRDVAEDRGL